MYYPKVTMKCHPSLVFPISIALFVLTLRGAETKATRKTRQNATQSRPLMLSTRQMLLKAAARGNLVYRIMNLEDRHGEVVNRGKERVY